MTTLISVTDVITSEADGYIDFTISLNELSLSQISVDYTTDSQSAYGSGNDYNGVSSTLIFAAGVTTQTVRVAIADDSNSESKQSFALVLSNATNAVIADG
ncbi:MAG: hypothetical protein GQ547_01170, partial [Methylophaga sp.]|nr:hypothetical protein [Methylophaga sp.]